MLGWLRRMLGWPPARPTEERSTSAVRLQRAEEQVRAQTVQVKRIRLEAQAAQARLERR